MQEPLLLHQPRNPFGIQGPHARQAGVLQRGRNSAKIGRRQFQQPDPFQGRTCGSPLRHPFLALGFGGRNHPKNLPGRARGGARGTRDSLPRLLLLAVAVGEGGGEAVGGVGHRGLDGRWSNQLSSTLTVWPLPPPEARAM